MVDGHEVGAEGAPQGAGARAREAEELWRDSIGSSNTTERLARYRALEEARRHRGAGDGSSRALTEEGR